MPFIEVLRLAFAALRANKLRSGLTMLGITIGVFSVISVMTATGALQNSVETGLSFLGSNFFQFAKYPALGGGGPQAASKYGNRHNISYEEATVYKRLMADTGAAISLKVFDGGKRVSYGKLRTNPNINIVGTNENFVFSNSFTIEEGRNFNESDVELARSVTIIGSDIRKRVFPAEDPIGKVIRINDSNFAVIGVLAEKGSSLGGSQDAFALMPITRFFENYGRVNRTVNVATQATSQQSISTYLQHGGRCHADRPAPRARGRKTISRFSRMIRSSPLSHRWPMRCARGRFVISSVALLAAGVGIMNIMLVSVTERTKEIGVRKSIGAKKRDILWQFLVEAVFLSELGGAVGILLGVAGGNALAAFLQADIIFPWGWAAAGLVVCSAIGIGFGMYPAWRAASLDPIEALRFE